MKALLDTHTFLWAIMDPDKLSKKVVQLLEDPANDFLVSVVVSWEIAIKAKLKRIVLPTTPAKFIPTEIKRGQFDSLLATHAHTLAIYDLPLHHHDPFDRLLIAQAQSEKLPIITKDSLFKMYDVKVIW